MIRILYFLLVSLIWLPVSAVAAADRSTALPPPTGVQNTPEARETVQRSGGGASLSKQFMTPKNNEGGQVRVYRRKDGAIIEEHSLHGRVYMIKVSPAAGTPPYYLYDRNGNGNFERQMPGGYQYMNPPEWVIKRF